MPADGTTVTVTSSPQDHKAAFGAITYSQVGTYQYTITEQDKKIPGVSIDTPVTATVTVRYENGALKADVAYSRGTDSAAFTNTYTAAPYKAQASTLFQVSKTLNGRDWTDSDVFEFTLTGEKGNEPLPPINQCKAVVTRGSTTTTFGDTDLTFNAAGKYVYYITEDTGSIAGVTYDTAVYKVVVSVTDDGTGKLNGTTQYFKIINGEQTSVEGTVAAFTNAYTAAPTDVTLTAHKTLNVESGSWALHGNDFSFALYDNADCTGTPLRTATNTENGSITFDALTFNAAGEYRATAPRSPTTPPCTRWLCPSPTTAPAH